MVRLSGEAGAFAVCGRSRGATVLRFGRASACLGRVDFEMYGNSVDVSYFRQKSNSVVQNKSTVLQEVQDMDGSLGWAAQHSQVVTLLGLGLCVFWVLRGLVARRMREDGPRTTATAERWRELPGTTRVTAGLLATAGFCRSTRRYLGSIWRDDLYKCTNTRPHDLQAQNTLTRPWGWHFRKRIIQILGDVIFGIDKPK